MDVLKSIENQRAYFNSSITRDVSFRIFQLKLLKKIVKDYEEQLIKALYEDLHKSAFESYASEISLVYEEIDYFIKHLPKWVKAESVKTSMIHFPSESYIVREPRGVSLIVSPWNYPVNLALLPLVGTIGAGNCCILKPSELTPNVSAILAKMINDHYKTEYIHVVLGDADLGAELTAAPFDHIFFTGSVAVGKKVMQAASQRLTPLTLELGGKSPCIVDETANLEVAAKRIIWGKLMNAGQTCVAPDYLLVQETVKDKLVHLMVEAIQSFYGPDYKASIDYPRIVSERHTARLGGLLEGTRVIYGGEVVPEERYVAPTLVDEVSLDSLIMKEEIFGPILPILTFDTLDTAIDLVRRAANPLALYCFSESEVNQNKLMTSISFGGGCINDTLSHVTNANMGFGGVGESGMGAYHGYKSYLTFSHEKSILKKGTKIDMALKYPPYNGTKLKALRQLIK